MSYNKAEIIGRIGQDIELRYTKGNTAVANISIATSERYKDKQGEWQEQTTWHDVVLWGRKAEIANEYLGKGSQVHVSGPIQKRTYEDKEGIKRTTQEIKALTLTMLDSKESNAPSKQSNDRADQSDPVLDEDFDDIDGDLPFSWTILLITAGSYGSLFI